MPWQSFPRHLTVAGIPKAIVTVRPQPRRPHAGWAQCDPLVLRRVHLWWWVGPLTREEEFRAAPPIIDPLQDPVWCEGFVHTRFGVFQVSPDAFASAVESGVQSAHRKYGALMAPIPGSPTVCGRVRVPLG